MDNCEEIPKQYAVLIEAVLRFKSLEISRATRVAALGLKKEIEDLMIGEWLEDVNKFVESYAWILPRIHKIRQELGISNETRSEFTVNRRGFVMPRHTLQEEQLPTINMILTHPQNPIKKLSLYNSNITDSGFRELSKALQHPCNKIVELDLGKTMCIEFIRLILPQVLLHPNCKIAYLDLRDNFLRAGDAPELDAAIKKLRREVVVEY